MEIKSDIEIHEKHRDRGHGGRGNGDVRQLQGKGGKTT